MTRKTVSRVTAAPTAHARKQETRKLTSDLIDEHVAAFEAAGGMVEVLETTRVLKSIATTPDGGNARG